MINMNALKDDDGVISNCSMDKEQRVVCWEEVEGMIRNTLDYGKKEYVVTKELSKEDTEIVNIVLGRLREIIVGDGTDKPLKIKWQEQKAQLLYDQYGEDVGYSTSYDVLRFINLEALDVTEANVHDLVEERRNGSGTNHRNKF